MTNVFESISFDTVSIDNRLPEPDKPGTSTAGYDSPWVVLGDAGEIRLSNLAGSANAATRNPLTYGVVYRCIEVIASTIAGIGWDVFERTPEGKRQIGLNDDAAWLLDQQANAEMTAYDWRQVMLFDALTHGNGYAWIERTRGRPYALWRIDPNKVTPDRDDEGRLVYDATEAGFDRFLDPSEVFHLRGLSTDGIVGMSPIALARRNIELGLREVQYGQQFFAKGPALGGLLIAPPGTTPAQIAELRKDFNSMYGGSENAGKVPVLANGSDFKGLTIPMKDAAFIESRKFEATEICRWYGVPPQKVGDLDRATWGNYEESEIAFVRDTLIRWCRRLETESNVKLFSYPNQGRRFTRLNLNALLRGNATTQATVLSTLVNAGIKDRNEARSDYDLDPRPGGDVLLVNGTMTPLDKAGAAYGLPPAAAPEPAPKPSAETPPKPSAETPPASAETSAAEIEAKRSAFGGLIQKVYARLAKIERDKAHRPSKHGQLAAWCREFYGDEGDHCRLLSDELAAVYIAAGRSPQAAADMARTRAVQHCQASAAEWIESGAIADDRINQQAAHEAAFLIPLGAR